MILGKGLCSINYSQQKNFEAGLAHTFFGKERLFGSYLLQLSNSFGYFSDPVKIGL